MPLPARIEDRAPAEAQHADLDSTTADELLTLNDRIAELTKSRDAIAADVADQIIRGKRPDVDSGLSIETEVDSGGLRVHLLVCGRRL